MSEKKCIFAAQNCKKKGNIMQNDLFVRYSTQVEAEEAFRKMLHLKDEWRAQVRECERRLAL